MNEKHYNPNKLKILLYQNIDFLLYSDYNNDFVSMLVMN